MTIRKFKTQPGSARIEAVEVEKETAKAVWKKSWTLDGPGTGPLRQHAKRSQFDNYFDSWGDAHTFLAEDAAAEVRTARAALQRANDYAGNVKGMKPPKEAA